MKKLQPTEHQIQSSILDWLPYYGIKALRINSGMLPMFSGNKSRLIRMAPAGTPDIIGCMKGGRMICIEVKRPGKKTTDIQRRTMEEWDKQGALVLVATSIDDVREALGISDPINEEIKVWA